MNEAYRNTGEVSSVPPDAAGDAAINHCPFEIRYTPIDASDYHKAAAKFLVLLESAFSVLLKAADQSFVPVAPPCAAGLVCVRVKMRLDRFAI